MIANAGQSLKGADPQRVWRFPPLAAGLARRVAAQTYPILVATRRASPAANESNASRMARERLRYPTCPIHRFGCVLFTVGSEPSRTHIRPVDAPTISKSQKLAGSQPGLGLTANVFGVAGRRRPWAFLGHSPALLADGIRTSAACRTPCLPASGASSVHAPGASRPTGNIPSGITSWREHRSAGRGRVRHHHGGGHLLDAHVNDVYELATGRQHFKAHAPPRFGWAWRPSSSRYGWPPSPPESLAKPKAWPSGHWPATTASTSSARSPRPRWVSS